MHRTATLGVPDDLRGYLSLVQRLVPIKSSNQGAWRQCRRTDATEQLRPFNPKQAIIARELALRAVELSCPPDAVHTPGIAQVAEDELSGMFSPEGIGHRHQYEPSSFGEGHGDSGTST